MVVLTETNRLEIVLGFIAIILLFHALRWLRVAPKGLRFPPGPKGLPLFGNVLDMPSHHQWETFSRWGKEYGDLLYLKVLGQPMVCVNSVGVARDLFEKRSSLYSDRFQSTMLHDLMGLSWNFPIMPYGDRWRRHRKTFEQYFNPSAAAKYQDIQTTHTRVLLRNFHESPDDFVGHLRHLMGAVIMDVVYGIKVLPSGDPYIELAEKAFVSVTEAANPGNFLVDMIPILKHVPEWMPGASFKKKARLWRALITDVAELPFNAVKKDLAAGTARDSVTASLLEKLSERTDAPEDGEEIIRNASGAAYGAASDTTVSALSCFMLAMVLYPEVQRKAQSELDSVVGMSRLPTFADRDNLPYTNALCKEIYRWHPVAPLGVAHRVTQDDVYGDYFIPGGSIVFGNAWAFLRDEMIYGPEPEKFIPERFLTHGVNDQTPAFGFGRRICPGRHMADNSIFIAVASILKVFNVNNARDEDGKDIPVEPSFTSGFVSYPEPFRCAIKPRSSSAEKILSRCANG